MTELKTLKDWSDKDCYCIFNKGSHIPLEKLRYISEKELRQEAIKWKEFIKRNFGNVNPFKAEDFIDDFFNITDEELRT